MEKLNCPNCGTQLEGEQIFCPTCLTNVRHTPRMTMIDAYKLMWSKGFDFSGRARRSEYWLASVFNAIVTFVIMLLLAILRLNPAISLIYAVSVIIPGMAMSIRRLHDTNRSGHWLWLALTGYGAIALIVFFCQDKKQPYNRFGKSSKWYSIYDLNGGESKDAIQEE